MAKWKVGDFAIFQRPHEPPAGVAVIEAIAEEPERESEKYFGVRGITALLDWSESGSIVRKPGEVWNAHFAELHELN